MEKWKEYNNGVLNNILNFYNCYRTTNSVEINNMQDLFVVSYVAEGVIGKEEFWHFCQKEILSDIRGGKNIYMIAVEELKNPNSRIENYKRCWKKVSEKYNIADMQLSEDIRYQKEEIVFYLGIAKCELSKFSSILKIMDEQSNKYVFFISDKDYFNQYEKIDELILPFLSFDKFNNIDNVNAINICSENHDISCRYGWDSTGLELDFIMNVKDVETYCKNTKHMR